MENANKLYDVIFFGVENYKAVGNEKNKSALLKAISNHDYFIKAVMKNIVKNIANIHCKTRHRQKILVGLGWENIDLIRTLAGQYDICILNPSKRLIEYCISNRNSIIFTNKAMKKALLKLYKEKDETDLIKEIKKLDDFFGDIDFLLFPDDLEPVFRVYLYAAKRHKIKSAVIQHGIFGEEIKDIKLGSYSDYFLVWGDWFKNICKGVLGGTEVITLGYPYPINRVENILFIGQPRQGEGKIKLIESLYQVCQEMKLQLTYRPHPAEDIAHLKNVLVKDVNLKFSTCNLQQDIKDAKIVIGMSSTVLMEALLYGKYVIQVDISNYQYDFSKVGNIVCIKNSYEEIKKAVNEAMNQSGEGKINPQYLRINPSYNRELEKIIYNCR
ncbi:hypothetical protein AALD74_04880 [Lachnospiraceae bacterium 48-21]